MKIKNRDLGAVCTALFGLGNHQGDITNIVEKKGKENDKGEKAISSQNKDYLKLMDLESDVDCQPFTLTQLAEYNPTVQELMLLESIIKEGD